MSVDYNLKLVVVLVVLVLSIGAAVVELNTANIDEVMLRSTNPWLIHIYAPWSGHCKVLFPRFNQLADILAGEVNVARIDGTSNPELVERFNVKGYATIKFIKDGVEYDHRGDRSVEPLLEYVRGGYVEQSHSQRPYNRSALAI